MRVCVWMCGCGWNCNNVRSDFWDGTSHKHAPICQTMNSLLRLILSLSFFFSVFVLVFTLHQTRFRVQDHLRMNKMFIGGKGLRLRYKLVEVIFYFLINCVNIVLNMIFLFILSFYLSLFVDLPLHMCLS